MALQDLSEPEIITKIQDLNRQGSQYAEVVKQYYQEIYRRYYSQCYNIARYYGLRRHDAEEAVQETFVKLIKSVLTFDPAKAFKPWFFRVLLNAAKDKFKENKRHRHIDMEVITENAGHDQEIFVEEFQLREVFGSIINKLPEKLKMAVVLRNYSGMDLESTAKALDVSVRQLHNRLAQAYEIIKQEMGEKS